MNLGEFDSDRRLTRLSLTNGSRQRSVQALLLDGWFGDDEISQHLFRDLAS